MNTPCAHVHALDQQLAPSQLKVLDTVYYSVVHMDKVEFLNRDHFLGPKVKCKRLKMMKRSLHVFKAARHGKLKL